MPLVEIALDQSIGRVEDCLTAKRRKKEERKK